MTNFAPENGAYRYLSTPKRHIIITLKTPIMAYKKILLFTVCAMMATSLSAQRYYYRSGSKNMQNHTQVAQIRQYVDSIRIYRQRLNTALAGNDSLRQAMAMTFRQRLENSNLSAPLTYYRSVPQRLFNLSDDTDYRYSDNAMLAMYLSHPEYVMETEGNLSADGMMLYRPATPVRQDVDFTSQAEEMYDDASNVQPQDDNSAVDLVAAKPNFWTFKGDYSLQFLQNYVSGNWYKGGESSYAMIGAATLQANYDNKEKVKWDNKLELKLGMQSTQGDSIHNYKSSEDLIRLTSKLGIQATKKWYYTLQMIAQTQFTHGYKNNDENVYSDFMSPFNLNLSLGMDYKLEWFDKHLTGTVNISPLAVNFKYYDRLNLALANSIYKEGETAKHAKWDFGSTFTADLVWKFSDLVSWKTRLYGFTSYHRAEIEWENTLAFQLSKYITTQVFVYPRFDDSVSRDADYGYFQLKEYWSLGFTYSF